MSLITCLTAGKHTQMLILDHFKTSKDIENRTMTDKASRDVEWQTYFGGDKSVLKLDSNCTTVDILKNPKMYTLKWTYR